jgi:hypothetical protein
MNTSSVETLNSAEREQFAAMVERMRQLRRRSGIPDGMAVADAVAWHMLSSEELERARWGEPELPTVATQEEHHGMA